jgi:hypothetical protein
MAKRKFGDRSWTWKMLLGSLPCKSLNIFFIIFFNQKLNPINLKFITPNFPAIIEKKPKENLQTKSNQKIIIKIENWKRKSASNWKITAPVEKPKLKYFHVPNEENEKFPRVIIRLTWCIL